MEIPHLPHLRPSLALRIVGACENKGDKDMSGDKKPSWVVDKERARRAEARETVWLFGLHAVRDALMNPAREKIRLVVTKNALDKLEEAVAAAVRAGARTADLAGGADATTLKSAGLTLVGTREATDLVVEQVLNAKGGAR